MEDIHPSCINNKIVKRGNCTTGSCFHVDQINEYTIESCTEPGTYDFFSNSNVSFILTFLGVSVFFCGNNFLILYIFLIIFLIILTISQTLYDKLDIMLISTHRYYYINNV